jgi:GT2 family glycosyltransferase
MPERAGYPVIEPVAEGVERPRWSVMIPTYNCAEYLRVTLKSVLEQDPGAEQMEIEVIDDRSTKDDPEAVVREMSPDGRVRFYRHPENVGGQANFTSCIERSRGHLVHILHGDDAVLPGFYEKLSAAFDEHPEISAAFCRSIIIDEFGDRQSFIPLERRTPGVLDGWIERIGVKNTILFPSIVARRKSYEAVGGFHPELIHTSDWDMWKRLAVYGPVWYEPEALALYREHSASDTSRLHQTGANIVDLQRAVEVARSYLPAEVADEVSRSATENNALTGLELARRMFARGDASAARAQLREALKCSRSPTVLGILMHHLAFAAGRGVFRMATRRKRRGSGQGEGLATAG